MCAELSATIYDDEDEARRAARDEAEGACDLNLDWLIDEIARQDAEADAA
jgi:hypothetical protein